MEVCIAIDDGNQRICKLPFYPLFNYQISVEEELNRIFSFFSFLLLLVLLNMFKGGPLQSKSQGESKEKQ